MCLLCEKQRFTGSGPLAPKEISLIIQIRLILKLPGPASLWQAPFNFPFSSKSEYPPFFPQMTEALDYFIYIIQAG